MAKVTIVGGGFSAAMAKMLLDKSAQILTPLNVDDLPRFGLVRSSEFELNKCFGKKSVSLGSLASSLTKSKLHDRLGIGGNSNSWGGFINIKDFPEALINRLNAQKIYPKKLSFLITGSISNDQNIYQLQNKNGSIYDAADDLVEAQNAYLESFFIKEDRIGLNLIVSGQKKIIYTTSLVLCVGVVQLLGLLHRSGFIDEQTTISLSEYEYRLAVKFRLFPEKMDQTNAIIRFQLGRAINHFFGIQKHNFFSRILSLLPIYVDQQFLHVKNIRLFRVHNKRLVDIDHQSDSSRFGDSIHYSDMKIDGLTLNHFFKKISPNIIGGGMAFVNQKDPGPISNDILLDLSSKLAKGSN